MTIADLIAKTLRQRENEESTLRIVQAGHPALRATSRSFTGQVSDEVLGELIEAMVHTMYEAPGVGLAAPQVGLPIAIAVMADEVGEGTEEVDADDDLYYRRNLPLMAVLNPSYESVQEDHTITFGWEGCLSVDGWRSLVPRPKSVRVRGTAIYPEGGMRELDEVWTGWAARIFQHETDHLRGVLCQDLGVPRSMVHDSYQPHYTELSDAVHYLGLSGDVTRLAPGTVDLAP